MRIKISFAHEKKKQQVTLDDVGGEPQAWISTIIQHDNNL